MSFQWRMRRILTFWKIDNWGSFSQANQYSKIWLNAIKLILFIYPWIFVAAKTEHVLQILKYRKSSENNSNPLVQMKIFSFCGLLIPRASYQKPKFSSNILSNIRVICNSWDLFYSISSIYFQWSRKVNAHIAFRFISLRFMNQSISSFLRAIIPIN